MVEKPEAPDAPTYVVDPLKKQPPERLDTIAEYAKTLADWKRAKEAEQAAQKQADEEITDEDRDDLEERDISRDPEDYEGVPASGAYITIKEPKSGYRYYYWQWREGDSWKNKYIAPVNPKR